ncbi:hypothetical protein NVS89_13815 [Ancylobacter sp. MQZ15Z-1]|uniref:Uncharacterized protein n=1 Tax=Ancylobacter mangrovi TaxID=2972472 RepID=A0A9X2T4K7_9HYPH|nr:hypothetical protein [Ancylobacter mangrovi]MCS0496176.1 hypothetical protein [Ancylobacter mangrovi]
MAEGDKVPNGVAREAVDQEAAAGAGRASAARAKAAAGTRSTRSSSESGSRAGANDASAARGARESARATREAVAHLPGLPPRHYSFNALVAAGVLGFVIGRICAR